jgi:excisionase family DNA binding protein
MKKTYSVSEAARLLGYSSNSIYSFLKSGEIKSSRLGKGKFRIPQAEIDRLLAKEPENDNSVKPVEPAKKAPFVPAPVCVVPPKPGTSLSEIGSDKPLRTIVLWFQERAGLPKLFDWFVALTSIVLGISLFLYTKQLDSLLVGRLAIWFTPIKIALLAGGVGLILADMLQEEHFLFKNFNNIFRYILVATYLGMAFLHLPARDIDGFLINGLFAVVILIEALFGVLSSTAYMFYVQGLLIGVTLILRFYPSDSGLSPLAMTVQNASSGSSSIFGLLALVIISLTLFGYFWNKMVLKAVLGVSGVALVALSVYYANVGYYARSFFILITGMVGMLLPFWEEFKMRYEVDRTLVYRMFGTVLMAFSLAVLIIGSVQTILINNSMKNLLEKTDLVKVSVESDVASAISTLEGLTQNSVFIRAFVSNNSDDMESFLKAVFKNNSSFNNVAITDLSGEVVAVYPISTELTDADFSSQKFFMDTVTTEKTYVSMKVEYFAPGIEKAIIVAIPITDDQAGEVLGVAMVTLSAEYLSDTMQRIAEGSVGQVITIVDNEGKWIVYPESVAIGTAVSEADATFDLWKMKVGQAKGYDRLGRYSLFTSEKSEVLAWSIVVSQPMATALDVSRSGLILVLFLLMMAALTVVFSYVFSKGRSYLLEKGV